MVKIHCENCPAYHSNPVGEPRCGKCSLHPPIVAWIPYPGGVRKEVYQPSVSYDDFCLDAPGQAVMPDEQSEQTDQPETIPTAVWDAAKEIIATGNYPSLSGADEYARVASVIWANVKGAAVGWKQ